MQEYFKYISAISSGINSIIIKHWTCRIKIRNDQTQEVMNTFWSEIESLDYIPGSFLVLESDWGHM